MANKKFSELTETTTPNSASIFATAYNGDNFKVTLTNIAANMPSITTSGTVTATTFIGNVTGNVTGSVTGNADTATALATGRTIGMTGDVTWTSASFDGTGNVTGTAAIGSGVIVNADVNASAAIDASKIHDGTVSNTEFGYLNGVTSAIQTQIDTKVGVSSTDTLTNKTINTASNTITIVEADISDLGSYITASSTNTLTNKTFDANGTGNSLSNVEVADLASGVLDTDLSSVAATDTTLASAKAIKTYVDSQVTAQDLDFQADTGGALSIDLDSETLTFTGGTGIDTSGSGNAVTFAIDSTVATLTGSQTLTNKTLTTPVISSISNTGTLTLPTSTDTLVGRATTDTLTNKTINSASNTITITESNISDLGSYITASSTDTLTNKSGNISQWTNDSAYLTGNQTITLSGDASGSGTTAITVTVADDSHNHIISNVDGLQTALDAKLANVVEDTTPQLGGNLDVNGNKIVSTSNADIDIEPNGTGNVLLGNLKFDADQTVGAGQDDYVLTYNNSAGTISLEAASGGGISSVVEDTSPQLGGTLDANGNTIDMDGNELILDSDGDTSIHSSTDDQIDFKCGGTDRLKIGATGRIDINGGSYAGNAQLTTTFIGNSVVGINVSDETSTGTHNNIQFLRNGTQVGKIETTNQTSTAYVTSSDYRLKENVNYIWDATPKLKLLKPAEFTWKQEFDPNQTQVQGFLAHEVSEVVPEAISGTKDAVDDDGNPKYQGIDQSKLVPLLVKTIQELETRITALENN